MEQLKKTFIDKLKAANIKSLYFFTNDYYYYLINIKEKEYLKDVIIPAILSDLEIANLKEYGEDNYKGNIEVLSFDNILSSTLLGETDKIVYDYEDININKLSFKGYVVELEVDGSNICIYKLSNPVVNAKRALFFSGNALNDCNAKIEKSKGNLELDIIKGRLIKFYNSFDFITFDNRLLIHSLEQTEKFLDLETYRIKNAKSVIDFINASGIVSNPTEISKEFSMPTRARKLLSYSNEPLSLYLTDISMFKEKYKRFLDFDINDKIITNDTYNCNRFLLVITKQVCIDVDNNPSSGKDIKPLTKQ